MKDNAPLVSDAEVLLSALFKEVGKAEEAPTKTERVGKWFEFVVGIGNDYCAYVTLSSEAYNMLYERLLKVAREKGR